MGEYPEIWLIFFSVRNSVYSGETPSEVSLGALQVTW